jgi:hypothetical protein
VEARGWPVHDCVSAPILFFLSYFFMVTGRQWPVADSLLQTVDDG